MQCTKKAVKTKTDCFDCLFLLSLKTGLGKFPVFGYARLMWKAIICLSLFLLLAAVFWPLTFCLEAAWDSRQAASYQVRLQVGWFSYTCNGSKKKRDGGRLRKRLAPGKGALMPALGFLLRHFRLKELFGEASFSTGDPAATALLWGAAEAFFQGTEAWLAACLPWDRDRISHRLLCLWQEEAGLRGSFRCMFRLAPGHIVITLLIFALSTKDREGGTNESAASY